MPQIIEEYKLLSFNYDEMRNQVQIHMKGGWQPLGGIGGPNSQGHYCQALVKYADVPDQRIEVLAAAFASLADAVEKLGIHIHEHVKEPK